MIEKTNDGTIESKQFASVELTEKERLYFNIMKPKYGILFLNSKPGMAKTAIAKSIAEKCGFQYIEIRLSLRDETDLGLCPKIKEDDNEVCYIKYAIPGWAIKANARPTLINFDELNRAPLAIRNAALQILLERCIGDDFCFNENVYMLATGNCGDADGTVIEEFDSALNNRLIHVKHELTIDEWISWAEGKVHKSIINFIKNNPAEFHKYNEGDVAFPSPRSWTMLSNYITVNYGMTSFISKFKQDIIKIGTSYVGNAITIYLRYIEELEKVPITDVIEKYDSVAAIIKKMGKSKENELLNELKEIKIISLKKYQLDNVIKFLKTLNDDLITGYLSYYIEKCEHPDDKKYCEKYVGVFKEPFLKHLKYIKTEVKKWSDHFNIN